MNKFDNIIMPLLAAALCLVSCSKQRQESNDALQDYRLEIGIEGQTKGGISEVSLNLADLAYDSSRTITAQLRKKSGTSWVNVTDGVIYSWTATAADSQKFSGSGTVSRSCTVHALSQGSGTITVSASVGGTSVASQGVPVTVADSRTLTWSDITSPIKSGEVKTAVLNSNFTGNATVSSDNGSFLVGTSSGSLSSTASVSFTTSTAKTVYYKYTGSSETTVKMYESFGNSYASVKTIGAESYGIGLVSGSYASSLTVQKLWSFTGSTRIYVNSPTGSWTYTKSPSSQDQILGEDEYTGLAYGNSFFDVYIISQNKGATNNRVATFTFYDSKGVQFAQLSFQHMNTKWTPGKE